MKRTRLVSHLIFFAFSFEIALYLVLSAPEDATPPPARSGPAPVTGPAPVATAGNAGPPVARDVSLFSGEFWEAGMDPDAPPEVESDAPAPDEEDTEILEPASADNPRNPQSGAPYTDRQMERFAQINTRFPGNTLVPRRRPDVLKVMAAESKIVNMERQAQRGQASAEQIDTVYRYYVERENANIRLLEYLKNFAETKEQQARHRWLQRRSQQALERRREQRERLLQRLEANEE